MPTKVFHSFLTDHMSEGFTEVRLFDVGRLYSRCSYKALFYMEVIFIGILTIWQCYLYFLDEK